MKKKNHLYLLNVFVYKRRSQFYLCHQLPLLVTSVIYSRDPIANTTVEGNKQILLITTYKAVWGRVVLSDRVRCGMIKPNSALVIAGLSREKLFQGPDIIF